MSPAPSRGVRLEVLAPLLVCGLVFAVATWAAEPYPVGIFHDDGVYVTLAKALATGEGFRYLNLPGSPVATHYPPAYPLLLAIQWKLAPDFPANIPVLQFLNALMLALTAWGVMSFGRKVLDWPLAATAAVALAGTLSYPLLGLSGHILSETLFAAALFPALIIGERSIHSSRSDDAWIAGAVVGLLTLVRTHGVALAAALVLVLLLRREWRRAAYVTGGVVLVLVPWQLFLIAHENQVTGVLRGKYASYLPWLLEGFRSGVGFVVATVTANVREVQALLADRFSISDHLAPRLITGIAATVVAVAGAVRLWQRAPVTALFAACYMVILLLWPFTPWRFFYAIWPVVILCIAAMVQWLIELRPRDAVAASAGLVVVAALGAGVVRAEHRAYRDRAWYHPAKRATEAVAPVMRWVAANTSPGDVVAVEAEQLVYLFTGRRAVPPQAFTASEYVTAPSDSETTRSLDRVLSEYPVTFVVTAVPQVYLSALLLADSTRISPANTRLVLVDTFATGGAFRVQRNTHSSTQP